MLTFNNEFIDDNEESLIAELELLGIRYISRHSSYQAKQVRSTQRLLIDLLHQPSSRVRAALIAVLLAHPSYGNEVPLKWRL